MTTTATTTATTTGVVVTGPGRVELRELEAPELLPGHVVVRTAYVGLCGTDRELFTGSHPYLAQGLSRYPLVPGHEWTGTVVTVGEDVNGLRPGDRVTGDPFVACGRCGPCRRQRRNLCARRSEVGVRGDYPGAAAGLFGVPERVCTLVPESVPLDAAVLAEPAVTVLEGLRRVRCGPGDEVAVLGTGTLGLLAVQIATASGARVSAVTVGPTGCAQARVAGASDAFVLDDAPADAFDVVLDAAGAPDGFARAGALAAPGGRIALLGMPTSVHSMDTTALVAKDLEVHAVLGGVANYEVTLGLLATGRIDATALLEREYPVEEAARAYADLADGHRVRPKLLLRFASATTDPTASAASLQTGGEPAAPQRNERVPGFR